MIARHWHGKTPASKGEEYKNLLLRIAIPDYQGTQGFSGLNFLYRLENNEAHFDLITYWDTYESIIRFAGNDFQKAKYYIEDNDFLIEFEENVKHYEVFATV